MTVWMLARGHWLRAAGYAAAVLGVRSARWISRVARARAARRAQHVVPLQLNPTFRPPSEL